MNRHITNADMTREVHVDNGDGTGAVTTYAANGDVTDTQDVDMPMPVEPPTLVERLSVTFAPEQAEAIARSVSLALNLTAPTAAAALTAAVTAEDPLAGVAVLDHAVTETITP